MGRFLSPDWSAKAEPVPYAKLGDPQTLNLYAYVGNNPLTRMDANGHYTWGSSCNEKKDAACHAAREEFRSGLKDLRKAANSYEKGSTERNRLER